MGSMIEVNVGIADLGDLISPTEPTSSNVSCGVNSVATPSGTGNSHNIDEDIFAGIDLKSKMEVCVNSALALIVK